MDDENFSATVLSKLPLADGGWRIFISTLADSWLEDLGSCQPGRCYEVSVRNSHSCRAW